MAARRWRGPRPGRCPGGWLAGFCGCFTTYAPLGARVLAVFSGRIFGAVSGAGLGVVMHPLQGARRDFDTVTMTVPSRYELVVDEQVADEAERLLADAPVVPTQ